MTLALIFESTLRTVAIAGVAGLGLALFRVKSSTAKLAVWRLVLYASLLMPLSSLLPARRTVVLVRPAPIVKAIRSASTRLVVPPQAPRQASIAWQTIALRAYSLIAGLLLLRAFLGWLRLRHLTMSATALPELGPDVYETKFVNVPVTCGTLHPRVLLPADWRDWPQETLIAVLAHERAHIREQDFLTQSLSKVNRAVYWANPLAWWLDGELARLAEHSSDDAALHRVPERPTYAAMLLAFAQRQSNLAATAGVSMARPSGVSSRIDRILDEAHCLSRPLSALARTILYATAMVAVVGIGIFRVSTVSAQTNPPKTSQRTQTDYWFSNDHDQQEWVLVGPRGTSMSGSSRSMARAKSLAEGTAGGYLWFTHNGREYLIDDAKTLAGIQAWFEPMEDLGRQQGELGEKQGALGEEMGKLSEEMAKLGEQMSHVSVEIPDLKELKQNATLRKLLSEDRTSASTEELQRMLDDLQGKLGEAQSRAGEKQAKIGELQATIGDKQALLGEQQGKLGELQGRLGEKQAKIAEEAERKLRRLFDDVIGDGRAKPVR